MTDNVPICNIPVFARPVGQQINVMAKVRHYINGDQRGG